MSYISRQAQWGVGMRETARAAGTAIMWIKGRGLPKKYGIEGDLREVWTEVALWCTVVVTLWHCGALWLWCSFTSSMCLCGRRGGGGRGCPSAHCFATMGRGLGGLGLGA
jgi:hypothetical protein